MKTGLLIFLSFLVSGRLLAQAGCTDPAANNYDPAATTNNGSCTYNVTSYQLTNPRTLPASLNENSGLIYTDGQLWTLNDSGGAAAIYQISETDGAILQTVTVSNATNTDWEALTADADYFYIGDFGNNTSGNRTDLKIYRVSKAAVGTAATVTVPADLINFAYQDQGTPTAAAPNNTKYDCEAFLVKNNQVHLFTKDWVTLKTVHYTLPATPGTHVAQRQTELAVDGLITDAHWLAGNQNELVLIGYTGNLFNLFMWILWDYPEDNFFEGNKRRIELGLATQGQIEGVTFTSNGTGYISSERIDRNGFMVPPRLYSFATTNWVPLPVSLIKFTAVYQSFGVNLTWQTATEQNNADFTVERSADAIHYHEIGRQKGNGTTQVLKNYAFTDPHPLPGKNYYRLKQTDLNGQFTYSPVRAVKVATPYLNFNLYPVPTPRGKPLHLQFIKEDTAAAIITLTSPDGKVWLETASTGEHMVKATLPTQNLQTGLYFLTLTSQQHAYSAKVLIW